jgi:hypothetical protein
MSAPPVNSQVPVFITADGSPTLEWSRSDGYTEKMHHSGGALAESVYIYHHALSEVVSRGWPVRVVSVGLGLGYNEWLVMAEVMRTGLSLGDWRLWSFETQDILKDSFVASLQHIRGKSTGEMLSIENPWTELFIQVRDLVASHFGLSSEDLRLVALRALNSGQFELRGSFPETANSLGTGLCDADDATCIFYDAFSNKMNSALWVETMITQELSHILAPHAVVATYAATGALNRALKSLGFVPQDRPGFQGKRESTLAIR